MQSSWKRRPDSDPRWCFAELLLGVRNWLLGAVRMDPERRCLSAKKGVEVVLQMGARRCSLATPSLLRSDHGFSETGRSQLIAGTGGTHRTDALSVADARSTGLHR